MASRHDGRPAGLAGGFDHSALAAVTSPNPPALTGLRGHSAEAMKIMHSVRDGDFWDKAPRPRRLARPMTWSWSAAAFRGLPRRSSTASRSATRQRSSSWRTMTISAAMPGATSSPRRAANGDRLWRLAVAAVAELFLAAGQQGAGRYRHRHGYFRHLVRRRLARSSAALATRSSFPRKCSATDALVRIDRDGRGMGAVDAAQRQGQGRPDRIASTRRATICRASRARRNSISCRRPPMPIS